MYYTCNRESFRFLYTASKRLQCYLRDQLGRLRLRASTACLLGACFSVLVLPGCRCSSGTDAMQLPTSVLEQHLYPVTTFGQHLHQIQTDAIKYGVSEIAYWGVDRSNYTQWGQHTNRLIPVYTYGTKGFAAGVDLTTYIGENSVYRSEQTLRQLYEGKLPANTLNPQATYMDQTQIYQLQRRGVEQGKKYVFLVVFDGLDWQTSWAAALYHSGRVGYTSGRGSGLHFLDYDAAQTSQFGYMVAAPHNAGTDSDVNRQIVSNPGGTRPGGYNALKAGATPWDAPSDTFYLIGRIGAEDSDGVGEHAVPDSAATMTAMTSGRRTFNGAINVDYRGEKLEPIAHWLQNRGFLVGAVSSVPISHATPGASYAHNVSRMDYQNIAKDLLGLPSASNSENPLPGMDVVIGTGHGVIVPHDPHQADNFTSGNRYVVQSDLEEIDYENGGPYTVVKRRDGVNGRSALQEASDLALTRGSRLFGFFGTSHNNLPYEASQGDFQPAPGRRGEPNTYTPAEVFENPSLADMTEAALSLLSSSEQGFWLMVEPGDVDWANHENNLDAMVGAVRSGDRAVRVITDWVEANSNWEESLMIITADHGHFLNILQPQAIAGVME